MKQLSFYLFGVLALTTHLSSAQVGQLQLVTIPAGAIIQDSLKTQIEKAPFTFTAVQPGKEYLIAAKGYESAKIQIKQEKKPGMFPYTLENCYPCLLEYNGSAFDEGVESSAVFRLRKKLPEHKHVIMLAVASPRIELPNETVVAMINGKKIKLSNDDVHLTMGYPQNMTYPVVSGLNTPFYDASEADANKDEKTHFYKAKLLVKPVIKKLEYRLKGKLLRDYTGPEGIECDWNFYSASDTAKLLGTVHTSTKLFRTEHILEVPVHPLVYEAARDLCANDTLFTFLEKLEDRYMQQAVSPPTSVKLTPTPKYATLKDMLKQLSASVVTVENESGFGSGIIVDPSGLVLTNHHVVIDDTAEVKVRIAGREESLPATIKVLNSDYDLALIQLPAGQYTATSLTVFDSLEVGDAVYAIGTPLDKSLGQTVTKGIVSGFRTFNGVKFIQTDVSINSGNSGGALVSESGKVIGIATMKANGKGIEGVGFCISAATVYQALQLKVLK